MSNLTTTSSSAGHTAYVAEVRELVHDQVDALLGLLMGRIERVATAGEPATQPLVSRGDRMLRLTIGRCSTELEVQATIDVPDGESRARLFPVGPARCIVRAPDGILARWDLRQAHPGDPSSVHAWMVAGTEKAVTESEAALVVDHLLACQSAAA
jgi:hypothetical protein